MIRIFFLYLLDMSWSQSCGPRMSPRLLMEIPCDMTKSSFCTLPGSAYPWSSVRRYIYENQGFMKRMYGEQRQSLVLRNEIDEIRDKYDSIYFYGRGRAQSGPNSFGPRSANSDIINEPHISSSAQFSFENNSTLNQSNNDTQNSTSASNESETKESLEREQIDDEDSFSDDEANPTTTTIDTPLQEANDIPNVTPYSDFMSSVSPQTTTTSTTNLDENEPKMKKGVNACPIKEEVIAPYWANNTRGETLALLNVYPFEQYIHWEKCAYENSQMFCRDGCRCEQQYRLHRLLAFDPKNDCRGIFADWFRFPGCCVCICYDLPESIRVNRRRARL